MTSHDLQAARRAYREAVQEGRPDLAAAAGRAFAEALTTMNALPAALAMTAADSGELCRAALAAPGDALAWTRATLATLKLNVIAERLADPDCTELAGRHLAACRHAAASLPAVFRQVEDIADAIRDVEDAYDRIGALILRHRAARADDNGRPDDGRRIREQALAAAPRGTYLETVLTIELGRWPEAHRQLDRLVLDDPEALADLHRMAGRPARAREILRGRPSGFDADWVSLTRRAAIAFDLGEHAEAETLSAQAIEVFQALQAQAGHDYYRTLATDHVSVAEMYHVAVRARLARGDVNGAFALADHCRAGMARNQPDPASAQLAATHERLKKAALSGIDQSHAAVVAEIMAAEDAVPASTARTPRTARQPVATGSALLLYQNFDQDLIMWLVRPDSVVVEHQIHPRRDLIRAARELHAACADFSGDGAAAEALAARLAKSLLDPIAPALAGVRRLHVVPPAHLMLLPFAVLPVNGVPLGDQHIVSVLPAAELLTGDDGARFGPDVPALLVGDPAYAGLPRLPGTGAEVRAIAAGRTSAVTLTEQRATVAEVRRHRPGRPVVHIATHGLVDELYPHLSELALAGHDRITLPDLAALAPGTELLVLSACHTGRGRATAGGDIFGLARAAIAAGVRHVIVSLWPVDDTTAGRLMTAMYEELTGEIGVAEALHRAAARLRTTDQDTPPVRRTRDLSPSGRSFGPNRIAHWAPFIHIGS